ncbi:MAG: APC family permease [Phycisphaerales bacterium]|nr:APC family permease [Phycisphaerales bacterium]
MKNPPNDFNSTNAGDSKLTVYGSRAEADNYVFIPAAGGDAFADDAPADHGLSRELGLLDTTMIVAGSMIGSGVFIVSADMARYLGGSGWLMLGWLVTGLITIGGALSYGELAAMMPHAGGQYLFLKESYSPLWGFLFGWTNILVIKTGSIAAVGTAFAKYFGELVPWASPTSWVVQPIVLSDSYAVSLSTQQLTAIVVIAVLTWINMRGVRLAKLVMNSFTFTKTAGLIVLAALGLGMYLFSADAGTGLQNAWARRDTIPIVPDFPWLSSTSAQAGLAGLFVAFCLAQVGSLFAADAWADVSFTAAESKNPRRDIPLAMVGGAGLVVGLYMLTNLAYVLLLPFDRIQNAPDDRVATAALEQVFGGVGAVIMAVMIMISTFGCNNGMILTGARVYYAMARDGLFFRATGKLNAKRVPAIGLAVQGVWSVMLVLPRTRIRDAGGNVMVDPATGVEQFGNLYSALLDYVIFAQLLFYVLTVVGLFVLRAKRPDAVRPYRAWGYPIVPALYVVAAATIMLVMLAYKTQTTWPGLVIVLSGIPAYAIWKWRGRAPTAD